MFKTSMELLLVSLFYVNKVWWIGPIDSYFHSLLAEEFVFYSDCVEYFFNCFFFVLDDYHLSLLG